MNRIWTAVKHLFFLPPFVRITISSFVREIDPSLAESVKEAIRSHREFVQAGGFIRPLLVASHSGAQIAATLINDRGEDVEIELSLTHVCGCKNFFNKF